MAAEKRKIFGFPGKYKSQVWESFGFYMDDYGKLDRTKAICRICRRAIAYSGNTTNLHNHVSHHHPHTGLYPSSSQMAPLVRFYSYSPDNSTDNGGSDTLTKTESEKSTASPSCSYILQTAILEFLINDLEPVQTLDSTTFRNLLKASGTKQDLPNSDYFTNFLLDSYAETRQKVINIVSTAKSVYLKLNIWKAYASGTNILTVSARILHSDMKVDSYVLQTVELPESYTHADISGCLGSIFSEWVIPETSIILSADVKEIADTAKKLGCLNINCLIDSINSAVKECLKKSVIEGLLNHARKLIRQFTENSSSVSLLQEKQTLLSLPRTKLKFDTKSSWMSSYEMLDALQEQAAAIYAVLKDPLFEADGEGVKLFSASEQTLTQNLLAILKSLVMAVSMITEMSFPSAAVILPVLKKLETTLKNADVDSQLIVDVKKCLWTKLSDKYSADGIRDFLLICSALDPRYKDLKFVEPCDKEKAINLVKQEMRNITATGGVSATRETTPPNDTSSEVLIKIEPLEDDLEFAIRSFDQSQSRSEPGSPVKRQKLSPNQKKATGFADWLDDVVHDEAPTDKCEDDAVAVEISRYESEKQIPSYSSPLTWWGERQYIYPLLSRVAKKYLSAPAMMKVNDSRQEVLERKRQCIAPEFLEYMVFLNANYFKVRKE